MTCLETLKIDLRSVQDAPIEVSCVLTDEYFQSLDDAEIRRGNINAQLSIRKAAAGEFVLSVRVNGSVTVRCDLCLEDMEQPIENKVDFMVHLGQSDNIDDDTIVVDENDEVLDTAWSVYETIALAVPIKHVHAPGKCNAVMTEKLKELSAARSGDGTAESEIDPRWAGLKKLME
jgi:uncharacterized metal-binding protein YceD (DUF177 family)